MSYWHDPEVIFVLNFCENDKTSKVTEVGRRAREKSSYEDDWSSSVVNKREKSTREVMDGSLVLNLKTMYK